MSSVADFVRLIKGNSSRWLRETNADTRSFAWQKGSGAFLVNKAMLGDVEACILNQREHHKTTRFEEEYIPFLHRHGIEYDERFVLN